MDNQKTILTICRRLWWGELEYQLAALPQANSYANLYKHKIDRPQAQHLFGLGQPVYLNNKLRVVEA